MTATPPRVALSAQSPGNPGLHLEGPEECR
jgi:hypothetical protein